MTQEAPKCPDVFLVTAHGRQHLESNGRERLVDLLNRYHVPWSAISAYIVPRKGGEPVPSPCLDAVLDEFSEASEILLYFNRNVNPFIFSMAKFATIDGAPPAEAATEYFYQQFDNANGASAVFLKKLTPDECRSIIARQVAETVKAHVPTGTKLVVGVSGGGDSNALLHGLMQIHDPAISVHPVIIKGIPDWDKGVPRARELCQVYGLKLTVVEEDEVKQLLGMSPDSGNLIDRFEREFKGDDFEFLGTLLVRLALIKHARDLGSSFICTGLNLEDILCEAMFRLSSGLKPAAFPARAIDDVTLVFPLWLCPKRVIDGCFPKFSLENYDARYPCFSLGRNLYYSIVYSMQSQFPGFIEQMTQGLSRLSLADPVTYQFDDHLGFHVERFVPFPLRQKFQKMLGVSGPAQLRS